MNNIHNVEKNIILNIYVIEYNVDKTVQLQVWTRFSYIYKVQDMYIIKYDVNGNTQSITKEHMRSNIRIIEYNVDKNTQSAWFGNNIKLIKYSVNKYVTEYVQVWS